MLRKGFCYCLLIVIVSLTSTCKQANDFLPPATQTGQNTLGCLIDGKPYVPNGGPPFSGTKPITGGLTNRFHGTGLGIFIYTFSTSDQSINIYVDDDSLGNHWLNTGNPAIGVVSDRKSYAQYISKRGYLLTSTTSTGWVNLTKVDSLSGIISGTFAFTAGNPQGETVTITNGRFDLNGRTL